MCMSVCRFVHVSECTLREQKCQVFLEMTVSHLAWVLGTELTSSGRTAHALNL